MSEASLEAGGLARRDREMAVTSVLLASTDQVALVEMEAWLEKLR